MTVTQIWKSTRFSLGMMVGHYVRCHRQGIRLIAAGVSPRVFQLFQLTRVENLFPIIATVEEADRS